VATRKKRPILYEVFRPEPRSGDPALKPRAFRPSREAERPVSTDEREPDILTTTTFSSGPTAPVARDRRAITISASTLTVLIAGMIVLLLVAFVAGRRYESIHPSTFTPADFTLETDAGAEAQARLAAENDAPSDQQTAAGPTGTEESADEANRRATGPTSPTPSQVTLQKGYHYVVVQHFSKNRQQADAIAAAKFLRDNGVPCATLPGADIRLVATQPFLVNQTNAAAARNERDRADRLLERIRQLGQQYNKDLLKQGKKGYAFSQCYLYLIR
jgi:hypothetical protein